MLAQRTLATRSRPAAAPFTSLQRRGVRHIARSAASSPAASVTEAPLPFSHVLLPVLDSNPYLSDATRQAVATAVQLSRGAGPGGRVTVLVVDEPGTKAADPAARIDALTWHLKERGCASYKILEKDINTPASVLVGDVADEVNAELVVISSAAVHSKYVDANQLAEFVSCPLLLLP